MSDAVSSTASVPLRPPSVWRLALRSLWRDLRGGELRVLFLAVALAVAALSAVGFFADRLDAGLQRDAAQLLGGDAVLVSDNPPPPAFAQQAQALGLRTVQTLTFPTMARADDAQGGASRLVALKGVAAGYPLRGTLTLQPRAQAPEQAAAGIPPRGEVWADAAVFESLGLQPGDALWLGDLKLRATALIANEPDRGAGFLNFAPRVMLNDADVAASGLAEARAAITQMRHNSVREVGLGAALGELLARFRERQGHTVHWQADPAAAALADERAETVFRIAEEALHNIERHAQARTVTVRLQATGADAGPAAGVADAPGTEAPDRIVLSLADDGVGFDPAAPRTGHYGLRGMRERVEGLGGALTIASTQAGTLVEARLPLIRETRLPLAERAIP